MPKSFSSRALGPLLCLCLLFAFLPSSLSTHAASNDNNVEAYGLFHDQGPLYESTSWQISCPATT